MQPFKNILVGVDLTAGTRLVSDELSPATEAAINSAMLLARACSASLTFAYAIDISPMAQRRVEQEETLGNDGGGGSHVLAEARAALDKLVTRARSAGLQANMHVAFGKSWLELIREVIRSGHDVVVAGTRHLARIEGMLLGSTSMKLLRKCPVPVWITQPPGPTDQQAILVAHCLRPVGETALQLGCLIAGLRGADLHVLHSVVPEPEHDSYGLDPSQATIEQSMASARQQIESELRACSTDAPTHIHVVPDRPDHAVLTCIDQQGIELLVMGTIARAGIAGFFTGNTAERILPQIHCSVLAVKPPGFVCPVTLPS